MVYNLLKVNLLVAIACLLAVNVWQMDAVEDRLLNLQAEVDAARGALEKRVEAVETGLRGVADSVAGAERRVADLAARGVRVERAPTEAPPAPDTGTDPRTLPYWATDDNILVDLDREPVPPPDAPRGGVIRYFVRSNPLSLNEHTWNDAELQEQIAAPCMEYIAENSRHDPDQYIPGLCNRVTVNEDFTEFTLYVRKGRYWQKPWLTPEQKRGSLAWLEQLPRQEITAEDIKFNFDVIRNPLSECGSLLSYLSDIDSVDVVDRYTAVVRWKKSSYFNKSSTLGLFHIYPKFIYERDESGNPLDEELVAPTYPQHWFNKMMCGSGPFAFEGFEPNQLVRFRRNPEWWGHPPVLDGIDVRIAEEATNRLNLFKAGELDALFLTPAQYRAEILEGGPSSLKADIEQGKCRLERWEMFTYYFTAWNLRNRILRDKAVRHALAHLYPREQVIRDVHYGLATPQVGPVHKFESSFAPDLKRFDYDPEEAARLLDGAGWKMGPQGVREKVLDGETVPLRLKFLYAPTSTVARDTILLFQKAARPAGVILEPDPREWTAMTRLLEDKEFDCTTFGWGQTWDGDPSQIWHSDSARSAKGSNYGSYISPELDGIIEELKREFDLAKRKQIWARFQRRINEDQPYLFDVITTRAYVIQGRVKHPYFNKIRPQVWFVPWAIG